jgi:hypothetical protein
VQVVQPRWAGGQVVWSVLCEPVSVDPENTDVAEEYIVVYSMDGDQGKPRRSRASTPPTTPNRATREGYSPLWRHNYVIVPHDYRPQTLRSEADVLKSGYRMVATDVVTN